MVVDGRQLAYFARKSPSRDEPDISLHARAARRAAPLGRIGEWFTWAGPIGIDESAPTVAELRQRCGNAPLMHVGIPDSTAMSRARYRLPRPLPPPPPPKAKVGG